ncbi:MAG: hypothetical protein ACTSPI_08840, partial [Candidatus Heimdallarchaeaceae archaeon]
VTISPGTTFIRSSSNKTQKTIDEYMIVEGAIVPTIYVNHEESIRYYPEIGRSLSNGVADEIDDDGVKTQRVSDDTPIADTDYDSLDNMTYTNVDIVKTTTTIIDVAGTTGIDGSIMLFDSDGVRMYEVAQADIDLTTSVGKFYVDTDKSIWYITAADAYADIAAARTGLGTTTVNYQLAEPIITQLNLTPLRAFENGTMMFEKMIPEVTFYDATNGCTISDSAYPIESIDYINLVDKDTGATTRIDVSTAVIAGDGLSFTHPDLADSDLIDWDYVPTIESTNPESIMIFPINNAAQVRGNTKGIGVNKKNLENAEIRVKANRQSIEENAVDIETNAANISTNTTNISTNTTAISDSQISLVRSATLSGTNAYTTTITDVTYAVGLKINATIANINTGASTLDINSLGVKNIKYYDVTNSKQNVINGMLRGQVILMYDGTDFVLLNPPVTFIAGNYIISDELGELSFSDTSNLKRIERVVIGSGTIRVNFRIKEYSNYVATARVYVNDVAVGIIRQSPNDETYSVLFSEDFTVNSGDKVQIYAYGDESGGSTGWFIDKFSISIDTNSNVALIPRAVI